MARRGSFRCTCTRRRGSSSTAPPRDRPTSTGGNSRGASRLVLLLDLFSFSDDVRGFSRQSCYLSFKLSELRNTVPSCRWRGARRPWSRQRGCCSPRRFRIQRTNVLFCSLIGVVLSQSHVYVLTDHAILVPTFLMWSISEPWFLFLQIFLNHGGFNKLLLVIML